MMIANLLSARLPGLLRWLALLSLLGQPLQAAEVSDLFQASVPVSSRESDSDRLQAFRAAMREVVVKLTGRRDSLDNPAVVRALNNPQPFVASRVYRSVDAADGETPTGQTEQIFLEVSFYESEIQRLLDAASLPVWPSNRPDTLVWLIVENENGERQILGSASQGSELLATVRRSAANRGLPLIVPIMDLEDQVALRPEQLWNFDHEALVAASARYQVESILALRLRRLIGGELIARSVYHFRGQRLEHDAVQPQLETFISESVDMAARELAANYAILLSGISEETRVRLEIDGINSIADYAGMLEYLRTLAVVKEVRLKRVRGAAVELELDTGGQLRQLLETIALDQLMAPVREPVRQDLQVNLAYQWQGD